MDNEIYEKAKVIMTQRRTTALSQNEQRIQEINNKIPEIKEINDALYATGKDLIRMVIEAKGKDISKQIESIKASNLGAQDMSKHILIAHGYPADYLDVHFTCPKCCDTGSDGTKMCSCMKQLCGKLMADELNENAQLTLSSFDTFQLSYYSGNDYFMMEKILNYTKQYAATFDKNSDSILMYGNTGLGKTHLSLAIANEVLKKGYSVLYDSIINILRKIESEHFSYDHLSDMLDLVMDTDLLILDDLGTEYETKFYSSTIYNIINTRLNRNKPTIISTNMSFPQLSKRYDERVTSRLSSMYTCLEFKGNDVRLQIKKQTIENQNNRF